jgi:hypothetical protein
VQSKIANTRQGEILQTSRGRSLLSRAVRRLPHHGPLWRHAHAHHSPLFLCLFPRVILDIYDGLRLGQVENQTTKQPSNQPNNQPNNQTTNQTTNPQEQEPVDSPHRKYSRPEPYTLHCIDVNFSAGAGVDVAVSLPVCQMHLMLDGTS